MTTAELALRWKEAPPSSMGGRGGVNQPARPDGTGWRADADPPTGPAGYSEIPSTGTPRIKTVAVMRMTPMMLSQIPALTMADIGM